MDFGQRGTTVVRRTYSRPGRQPMVRQTRTVRRVRRAPVRGGRFIARTPTSRMISRQMQMRRPTNIVTRRGSRIGNPCLLNGRIGAYVPGVTLNRQVGLRPQILWRGI
jgi:hypothetical protein